MPAIPEFRCGPLRWSDWKGFWKAAPDSSIASKQEWDAAWSSLRSWLSQRYLAEWEMDWQRHCCVEDISYGDWIEGPQRERTLKIIIEVAGVLTTDFLSFVQQWLREKAPFWRVSIPVDNIDENLILIYPDAIRVNPDAEANLDRFIQTARPRLAASIEKGFQELGLRRKPIPPLPILQ